MHADHVTSLRGGPAAGTNPLLSRHARADIGLDFSIEVLEPGETLTRTAEGIEHAALIVSGRGTLTLIEADGERRTLPFDRPNWIEVSPTAAHGCAGTTIAIVAETRVEIAVLATDNTRTFPGRLYAPGEVATEHRGRGLSRTRTAGCGSCSIAPSRRRRRAWCSAR